MITIPRTNMENNRRVTPKYTCYFCNKTLENETEVGHTSVCGNVLVPCPNNCGAYIQRMALKKHNVECINKTNHTFPKQQKVMRQQVPTQQVPTQQIHLQPVPVQPNPIQQTTYQPVPNYMVHTDARNMIATKTLPKNTNDVKNDNKEELYKLSRKLADLESRFHFQQKNQNQTSVSLQNFENLKTAQLQLNLDIEKLKYQTQIAYDWRTKTDTIISTLRLNISNVENYKREIDSNLMSLQNRIMLMEKLQDQISYLKDSFLREQAYNRQVDMDFNEKLEEVKKLLAQENAKSAAILGDLKDSVDGLRQDMEGAKARLEDQGIQFTNIIYDLKGVGLMAAEGHKKMEKLEEDFSELKKQMTQMKLDMEILESLSGSSDFRPKPGRLLWKITEVDTKMVQAKQSNSVIKSPIFFTHEYGYRVRILMYMNGLKKWKDRYALLCVHVLKGEYDMVLNWPCQIEGYVTLRPISDAATAKPFTKLITAKRQEGNEECEEPQESSSCYIFIPHTTLFKNNYLKDDTIFIDIKIKETKKLETSL
uniref:TNF receptor-associated factor 3-like n=1 Tax=Diabrotica virgifera virgifera TaxID=50390 RepID=A0A6P7FEY5_DIAVI